MNFFDYIINKKLVLLIVSVICNGLLLAISGFLFWNVYKNQNVSDQTEPKILATTTKESVNLNEKFYVDVKGEVKTPGVYEVQSSNIINDVITLAGGFTKKAYTKNINLSRKVSDELVIYVFTENEYKKAVKTEQEVCECASYDISNCTNNSVSEIISSDKDSSFTGEEISNANSLININKATKEELMNLSGIGEGKAVSIIEYRNSNGVFKSVEEIKNVSGIGDALFDKIKNNITV